MVKIAPEKTDISKAVKSSLGATLLELFEPLGELAKGNSFIPSVQSLSDNKGVMFFLDNSLRAMHYQLHGAAKYGSLKERMDQSSLRLDNLWVKHHNDPQQVETDPEYEKLHFYDQFNTQQYMAMAAVYNSFMEVYEFIFNTPWVYTDRTTGEVVAQGSKDDLKAAREARRRYEASQQADENSGPAPFEQTA